MLDLVNPDPAAFGSLAGLLRDGGHATSIVGGAGDSSEIGSVLVSNSTSSPAHLAPLAELIAQGKLRAAIRRTYPLAEAARAMEDFSKKHTLGKLVTTMT